GGSDWLVEMQEQLADRTAERIFDFLDGFRHRECRHAILKQRKIVGDIGTNDVGTRGKELPELDVGRAEAIDRARHALGTLGALGAATGKQARETPCKSRCAGELFSGESGDHTFTRHYPASSRQPEPGCRS